MWYCSAIAISSPQWASNVREHGRSSTARAFRDHPPVRSRRLSSLASSSASMASHSPCISAIKQPSLGAIPLWAGKGYGCGVCCPLLPPVPYVCEILQRTTPIRVLITGFSLWQVETRTYRATHLPSRVQYAVSKGANASPMQPFATSASVSIMSANRRILEERQYCVSE